MEIRTNLLWVLVAGLLLLPAAAPAAMAQDEGIKVHGDWVIEVLDPNGTVVGRTEFSNALTQDGALALRLAFGRVLVPRYWMVMFDTSDGVYWYGITEPARDFNAAPGRLSKNLSVGVPDDGSQSLLLSGTIMHIGTAPTSVTAVRTNIETCTYSAQQSCHMAGYYFTTRALPQPISVQPGQIIQVTVRIRFS
jgi:hypothetical protein